MDATFATPIIRDTITGLTVRSVLFQPEQPLCRIVLVFHHESGLDEEQPPIEITNAEAFADLLADTALPSAVQKLLGHLVKIGKVPSLSDPNAAAVQP